LQYMKSIVCSGVFTKTKDQHRLFVKSRMMPENFVADANARFFPTLVMGLIRPTRA